MASEDGGPACESCGTVAPESARFCPSCGSGLDPAGLSPTRTDGTAPLRGAPPAPSPAAASLSTSGPGGTAGGFAPGALLADRYRIVALLGRGGMGVVYRADDLRLGQAVALKFLPPALAEQPGQLESLFAEARNARQVSHPNVCRVHDIGEHAGQHFLSMEYVDGEDLASLLKRIGRLPAAKALELAHQICAGLSAAHARGVLHRDLKPANVMIDGHGRARITDFGLAAPPEEDLGAVGTPVYMAPEQLSGGRASFRSDIWALGLVLFELHTGRRAFPARDLAELRALHAAGAPAPPSRYAPDVDPAVERTILRCLEADPAARPRSAREVAAALPGGDPLAAALAGGETPSPDMVAAAGAEGSLQPRGAWSLLASVVLLLTVVLALGSRVTLVGIVRPAKSPEALAERARELATRLGFGDEPADVWYGFTPAVDALRRRAGAVAGSGDREASPAEALIRFSYRQSPAPLTSVSPLRQVSDTNPPLDVPGMLSLSLDVTGRLLALKSVPMRSDRGSIAPAEPDWNPLLRAADLDVSRLESVPSTWVAAVPFDQRQTWRVEGPAVSTIRVEAASWRGRPVYFSAGGSPAAGVSERRTTGRSQRLPGLLWLVFMVTAFGLAAYFARRNLRLGRGDRRGAFTVAVALAVAEFLAAALRAHHAYGSPGILFAWLRTNLASATWAGFFVWLVYLALEPYARRNSPDQLISWNRALAARWRDPRVGRDLLAGALAGAALAAAPMTIRLIVSRWTGNPIAPLGSDMGLLLGARHYASILLASIAAGLINGCFIVFCLVVAQAILRYRPAAVLVTGLLGVLTFMVGMDPWVPTPVALLESAVLAILLVGVIVRLGLLVGAVAAAVGFLLGAVPLTLNPAAWYAGPSLVSVLLVLGVALYGFLRSLGGRAVFAAAAEDL